MVSEIVHTNGCQKSVHEDGTITNRSEYYWKSTDEKPVEGVENADIGYEIDTKKVYLFDGSDKIWIEQ